MRTAFTSFKPQLESLEGRDLPSGVGAPVLLTAPVIEQGVQAMQQPLTTLNTVACPVAPVNTVACPVAPVGQTIANPAVFSPASNLLVQRGVTDLNALGRDAHSLGALSVPLTTDAQALNQAVFMALGDADHALAAYEYLQLNGSFEYGAAALGQLQSPTAPANPAGAPAQSPAAPASPANPFASPAAPANPANPFANPAAPADEIALLSTLDGNPSS
ncbi:MAG TPA: hypothetical protein VH643_38475 [Gemmataceae bacterium]|jgi:hypothetical protein